MTKGRVAALARWEPGPAPLLVEQEQRTFPEKPVLDVPQVKGRFMATKANAFDVGDYVVYPKHGVGRVIELQEQEIAGMKLELYVLRCAFR